MISVVNFHTPELPQQINSVIKSVISPMLQTRLRSFPAHPSQTHGWPVPSGTGHGTAGSPESDKTSPCTCGHSVTEAQSQPAASHIAVMCKAFTLLDN